MKRTRWLEGPLEIPTAPTPLLGDPTVRTALTVPRAVKKRLRGDTPGWNRYYGEVFESLGVPSAYVLLMQPLARKEADPVSVRKP
ncbi:MAG: hypothetical protein JWM61_2363 [Micrococcaceae bacterium]|nr:hypothetical protein [Micrococcaceae bacterium]